MSRRNIVLRPQAQDELREAITWYEQRSPLLAARFRQIVDRTFDFIAFQPESSPVVRGKVRRKLTVGFPYAVFYAMENKDVVVLSVIHEARDPARWPAGT